MNKKDWLDIASDLNGVGNDTEESEDNEENEENTFSSIPNFGVDDVVRKTLKPIKTNFRKTFIHNFGVENVLRRTYEPEISVDGVVKKPCTFNKIRKKR